MENLLSLALVGLDNREQLGLSLLFMHTYQNKQYGEVPGVNLRLLYDMTKEKLFHELEILVKKNVFKYSPTITEECCYIVAGKGYYVFNPNYKEWVPSSTSLFSKLTKLMNIRFNAMSYKALIESLNLREPLKKIKTEEKGITTYEIFDLFCVMYKQTFGIEYVTVNAQRDYAHIKKLICDMSYANYGEQQIRDFIVWCFMSKARNSNCPFIVGFLPTCLNDYQTTVKVDKMSSKYKIDENGNLRTR